MVKIIVANPLQSLNSYFSNIHSLGLQNSFT